MRFIDQLAEAEHSAMYKDKDSGKMGFFSAFLPSGYFSPIGEFI